MKPTLIFDGECGFCRHWVQRGQKMTGDAIEYAPFQEAAPRFPQIPKERFAEAVQLVDSDGRVYSAAEAVLRSLSLAGRGVWLYKLYRRSGLFAAMSERLYRMVADHRTLLSQVAWNLRGGERESCATAAGLRSYPGEYTEFVTLFNRGNYYEGHEILEALWTRTEGELKLFYQGLIQAAVALHHFQKGNKDGCAYERRVCLEKLKRYPDRCQGLDVRRFETDFNAYLSGHSPKKPSIQLS